MAARQNLTATQSFGTALFMSPSPQVADIMRNKATAVCMDSASDNCAGTQVESKEMAGVEDAMPQPGPTITETGAVIFIIPPSEMTYE